MRTANIEPYLFSAGMRSDRRLNARSIEIVGDGRAIDGDDAIATAQVGSLSFAALPRRPYPQTAFLGWRQRFAPRLPQRVRSMG